MAGQVVAVDMLYNAIVDHIRRPHGFQRLDGGLVFCAPLKPDEGKGLMIEPDDHVPNHVSCSLRGQKKNNDIRLQSFIDVRADWETANRCTCISWVKWCACPAALSKFQNRLVGRALRV